MSDVKEALAVEYFVNHMIGAFDSGFVDGNTLTLATIYQVMRNHCKDEFGMEVDPIDVVWGDHTAKLCSIEKPLNLTSKHWRKTIQETLEESESWQNDEIPPFWSPEFEAVLNEILADPAGPTHYAVIDEYGDIVTAVKVETYRDAKHLAHLQLKAIAEGAPEAKFWTVKGVTVHEG